MFNLPKPSKPKTGKLILLIPGSPARVLESGKPFPVLQNLKKTYLPYYKKENLKITY